MPSGYGSAPYGSAPWGTGTPATTSARPQRPLVDPETGDQEGSRYIDPRSGDYSFDSDGRAKGMPNARHLVLLALLSLRGSTALGEDFGLTGPSGVIGADFVARRRNDVEQALKHLTDRLVIELVSVEVTTTSRPVITRIRWRDLTTSEDQTEVI